METKIKRQDYSLTFNEHYIKINVKHIGKTISLEEINLVMNDVQHNNKTGNKQLIVSTGEQTLLSKEARERIIDLAENESYIIGVIIHDLAQRILGNFIINILKNKKAIKLFTDEKKAIQWFNNN